MRWISQLYAEVVDQAYLETWDERAVTFRSHLKEIGRYAAGAELLDVGCYAGVFLSEAKKSGYLCTGLEPSNWAARHARQACDCPVVRGSAEEAQFRPGSFDFVTLWDVAEHLQDPKSAFASIRSWLRPGGGIAVSTHDISSLAARLMGRRYSMADAVSPVPLLAGHTQPNVGGCGVRGPASGTLLQGILAELLAEQGRLARSWRVGEGHPHSREFRRHVHRDCPTRSCVLTGQMVLRTLRTYTPILQRRIQLDAY